MQPLFYAMITGISHSSYRWHFLKPSIYISPLQRQDVIDNPEKLYFFSCDNTVLSTLFISFTIYASLGFVWPTFWMSYPMTWVLRHRCRTHLGCSLMLYMLTAFEECSCQGCMDMFRLDNLKRFAYISNVRLFLLTFVNLCIDVYIDKRAHLANLFPDFPFMLMLRLRNATYVVCFK